MSCNQEYSKCCPCQEKKPIVKKPEVNKCNPCNPCKPDWREDYCKCYCKCLTQRPNKFDSAREEDSEYED